MKKNLSTGLKCIKREYETDESNGKKINKVIRRNWYGENTAEETILKEEYLNEVHSIG